MAEHRSTQGLLHTFLIVKIYVLVAQHYLVTFTLVVGAVPSFANIREESPFVLKHLNVLVFDIIRRKWYF